MVLVKESLYDYVGGFQVYWTIPSTNYFDREYVDGIVPFPLEQEHPVIILKRILTEMGLDFKAKADGKGGRIFSVGVLEAKEKGLDVKRGSRFRIDISAEGEIDFVYLNSRLEKVVEGIRERFNKCKNLYFKQHLSNSLIGYILRDLKGLRLRQSGGVYFVPKTQKEKLDRALEAYEKLGFVVTCLGLLEDSKLVTEIGRIVKDAVSELEKNVREFREKFDRGELKRLRRDGIETREENIEMLMSVIEENKYLLGEAVENYKKLLEELRDLIVDIKMELEV